MEVLLGYQKPYEKIAVNTNQTIKIGNLLVQATSKASTAAAAPAANTVLGVATSAITTGGSVGAADTVYYIPVRGEKVRAKYVGSSKTSLTDADLGTVFDLSDKDTVNLDDTTGGICLCVGYDNTNKTIDFYPIATSLVY